MAGTAVGSLTKEAEEAVEYNLQVIQVASHDTASAVLAVPAVEKDFLYISSGTWSLMGVERQEADCSEESRIANFTSEGGSNAGYLNELTARQTKKTVYCGPSEATAIGNIAVQLMRDHVIESVAEARAMIQRSFEIKYIKSIKSM